MADVQPLNAVHYDLSSVPSLADVVAPPYDVIDAAMRAELLGRSPFNVVEIDLPEGPEGVDGYEYAAQTMESWLTQGVLGADREPTLWALTQDYTAPDGRRMTRSGFLCRVKLAEYGEGIRPHERTQPGPKEDRLRLTRATRHNLSPIFSLSDGDAWPLIEPATGGEPWSEVTDADGTTHRIWRIEDPAVHEAVTAELADAELLIADGHHRYETAMTYAREVGGEGPHQYVLMALVSLSDPGLTVFGTHRLLKDLDEAQREAVRAVATELFELEEVSEEELVPGPDEPPASFGYMDAHHGKAWRLRLLAEPGEPSPLDEVLGDRSEAYRRLDAAALEELFLKRALGLSADDIAAKRNLGYTPSAEDAIAKLDAGECDAAFFLRPTPVELVREVAAAGETMPPKSTYFFPKLLTGIAFNPL
ncbi:MAG: DUF1015 domain-containing protein [Solirubrobacterales bacterium]|nr:DUF1015 domain-containing protein [Solirubrobacterales bacterium]